MADEVAAVMSQGTEYENDTLPSSGPLAGGTLMAPPGPWKWTPEALEELAQDLLEWAQDPDNFFLKEFTSARGLPYTYVARFCRQNLTFAEAVDRVNDILEVRLLRGGLKGKLEHHIVKLVASAKYGVCEKTDLALSAEAALPTLSTVEDCDRAIAEAQTHRALLVQITDDANAAPSCIVGG